ncbi:MAG TPA: hypothetical protein VLD37_06655 [Candidatus Bilamarchaeum sp.]|nr:hypothetical protein [Candidatus Bilamarchaeum sp.]
MRYWPFLALATIILSAAYVIYWNDLLFILIALAGFALFSSKRGWGAALFAISLMASGVMYYYGDSGGAFRMAVASFGMLCGAVSAAVAMFREGKDDGAGARKRRGKDG